MNHAGNFWRSNHPFAVNDGELGISQQYLASGVVTNRINVTNPLFSGYTDLGDRYENGRTLTELLLGLVGHVDSIVNYATGKIRLSDV